MSEPSAAVVRATVERGQHEGIGESGSVWAAQWLHAHGLPDTPAVARTRAKVAALLQSEAVSPDRERSA